MKQPKNIYPLIQALQNFYMRYHTYYPVDTECVFAQLSLVNVSLALLVTSLCGVASREPPRSNLEIFEARVADLVALVTPLRHHDEEIRQALQSLEQTAPEVAESPAFQDNQEQLL